MKDTREIVLFFDNQNNFKALDLAKEITNRFNNIGSPIILPENKDIRIPQIIFNSSSDMQIQVSKVSLDIAVSYNNFKDITSIIFDCIDLLEEYKLIVNRIGYICNTFMSNDFFDKIKDKYLNYEEFKDVLEINFGLYRKIENKYGIINAWEKVMSNNDKNEDILFQFDFNSPKEEKIKMDIKYIKEFVKSTDEFMDNKVNL